MVTGVRIGLIAAGCIIGLAGCTVPTGGVLGVTVDLLGRPVVVVQMCEGHIDGASLYLPSKDGYSKGEYGSWRARQAVTGFSQFNLVHGGNGWRPIRPPKPRDPETRYTMYGWSEDSSWSANEVSFSQRDLQTIGPGTVLIPSDDSGPDSESDSRSDPGSDLGPLETTSLTDFRTKTCAGWS